jgi:hypothetical protein
MGAKSTSAKGLLNSTRAPILLTVDACHTGEGWRLGVEPGGLVHDRPAAVKTLARLRAFAAKFPQTRVYHHEADNWDLTRGVQEPLATAK